jgi:hypothetical protein
MWLAAFSLSRFLLQILHEIIKYDIELGVVKCLLKFEHSSTRIAISELILLYQNLGPKTRPPFLALDRITVMRYSMTITNSRQEKFQWNANLAEYGRS